MTAPLAEKLGLGTAQFGMDYGATNRRGHPSPAEVAAILRAAHDAGVRTVDTAPSYGSSEAVLGAGWPDEHQFRIVTKTPVFGGPRVTPTNAQALVESFFRSLDRLQQDSVYALLIHRALDLLAPGGHLLMEAMLKLKGSGRVSKVGVSVYTAAQIDDVLRRYAIDIIQLPLSVLDQRLVETDHLRMLADRGIEIHSRSAFLQGLLVADPAGLDDYFRPIVGLIADFQDRCRRYGLSPLQGALGFCFGRWEVTSVVVGVSCLTELREVLRAAGASLPMVLDSAQFACDDDRMVDPSYWPSALHATREA